VVTSQLGGSFGDVHGEVVDGPTSEVDEGAVRRYLMV
jgi:hypothetical protein